MKTRGQPLPDLPGGRGQRAARCQNTAWMSAQRSGRGERNWQSGRPWPQTGDGGKRRGRSTAGGVIQLWTEGSQEYLLLFPSPTTFTWKTRESGGSIESLHYNGVKRLICKVSTGVARLWVINKEVNIHPSHKIICLFATATKFYCDKICENNLNVRNDKTLFTHNDEWFDKVLDFVSCPSAQSYTAGTSHLVTQSQAPRVLFTLICYERKSTDVFAVNGSRIKSKRTLLLLLRTRDCRFYCICSRSKRGNGKGGLSLTRVLGLTPSNIKGDILCIKKSFDQFYHVFNNPHTDSKQQTTCNLR